MSHKKIILKKKLIIAVTLVCSVCSILSSCKNDDNIDNSAIKYTDYKTAFNADFIKEKGMDIDFSKFKVDECTFDELYTFDINYGEALSDDEYVKNFETQLKKYIGNKYTKSKMYVNNAFNIKTGKSIYDDEKLMEKYKDDVSITDFEEINSNNEYSLYLLYYEDLKNNYLFTYTIYGVFVEFRTGESENICYNQNKTDVCHNMFSNFELKKKYKNIDMKSEDVLKTKLSLKDGKHTLKEIVDFTEKSINKLNKSVNSEFEYFVSGANILKVDDNLDGVSLPLSVRYKGVDVVTENTNGEGISYDNAYSKIGKYEPSAFEGEVGLIYSNKLDSFNTNVFSNIADNPKKVDQIISLKSAMQKIDEDMASKIGLQAKTAKIKYLKVSDPNDLNENNEAKEKAIPVWELSFLGHTGEFFVFYVDTQTGEYGFNIYNNDNFFEQS